MSNPSSEPIELIPDSKTHIVTLKLQTDLYEWVVREARQRRTTMSYIIRELVDRAVHAQKEK